MRIHSDVLTYSDLAGAASRAGFVTFVKCEEKGSRSRQRAFDVILSGTSSYRTQWHDGAGEQAATWDEWGIFLGALFDLDPNMHCGKNSYQSADHYHWMTGDRFRALVPAEQHKRHQWQALNVNWDADIWVYECKCGAISRRTRPGVDWHRFASAVSA